MATRIQSASQRVTLAQANTMDLQGPTPFLATTAATTVIPYTGANQSLLGLQVSGPFVAAGAYIVSAVNGVSITVSAANTVGTGLVTISAVSSLPDAPIAIPTGCGQIYVNLPCWVLISTGAISAAPALGVADPLYRQEVRPFRLAVY